MPLPRVGVAAALLVATAAGWDADGYPDCGIKEGPACYPNRRASSHNSLLNSLFNKYKVDYWSRSRFARAWSRASLRSAAA